MTDSEFYRTLLRAYIDSANDGIFVLCDEMKFHVANPLLESWLLASEESLTEHKSRRPITDFFGDEGGKEIFCSHFDAVLATGQAACFECFMHPAGAAARWIEIGLSKVELEFGDMLIGVARDVSERKLMQEEMEHRASHDHMTGLINRREFEHRLKRLVESAQKQDRAHALLYMDLDQFKVVNDTCGHMAGDILLSRLSARIKEKVRASDTLARLGGDEFGLLLEDCPIERAMQIAEMHKQAIMDFRFVWEGKIFVIGVSIGLVPITAKSGSAMEAMSTADAACYLAKDKGGNCVHLDSDIAESHAMRGQMHWVAKINAALHENRFCLFYQRIVPVAAQGNQAEHDEILVRMLDEDGHIVPPIAFIPAAEKYNLMPAIDRWVISSLFASKSEQWRKASAQSATAISGDAFCAINLSGATINDAGFSDFLLEQIAKYQIPTRMLCFEITETAAIGNLEAASRFIHAMKMVGCRFSLDDFGSGMSSFAYLKNLDVDFLKIDGALVKDIVDNPVSRVMVEAINKIGHAMHIKTVAEFVENDEILNLLKEIGVDYAQGYGIHKPEHIK